MVLLAGAQDSQQPNANQSQPATVHGLVRNVISGEPLARALVRIEGDAATGVLTDGDGRFEIADVPTGPQIFDVIKPGFLDSSANVGNSEEWGNPRDFSHNVIVAANMPELDFYMRPVNSIRGQIQLSTGDPAQGINVALVRRSVQDGRAIWQQAAMAPTNTEGIYRFGELPDGTYAVYTTPAMDSDMAANVVENGSGNKVARQGYASLFYPDSRDLAGAAKIHLSGGEQAQANISLALEPFHSVTAIVTMPGAGRNLGEDVTAQVTDTQGRVLPYSAQYDGSTHRVQAVLPDGSYSFVANLIPASALNGMQGGGGGQIPAVMSGSASFAVSGRAVDHLRIPISRAGDSSVQVMLTHEQAGTGQIGDPEINITLTQGGGSVEDAMIALFADGHVSKLIQTQHPPAGSYWVHTNIAPKTLCESSLTAGGANLAREPLVIGDSHTAGAPLVLSLRDDCAKLTLILPASVTMSAGIERFFTVYVVPDFDSTEDVVPQTLRLSTGGRITMTGLTPGNYHVYTFDHPVELEYRNPTVLGSLPSQAVSVAPASETEITVEVPHS
jgi:prepilin-type processing-associated H-X9-DG protein